MRVNTKWTMLFIISITMILLLTLVEPIHADLPDPTAQPQENHPYVAVDPVYNDEGVIIEDVYPSMVVIADETKAISGINFPVQEGLDLAAGSTSFVIDYVPAGEQDPWRAECTDFPEGAKTAFDYAASIWAATINTTVPISIRACWADLDWPKLGYSGGGSLYRDFPGAPLSGIYYFSSLANALHGADLDDTRYDMYITYNSDVNYYYGLDANTLSHQHDFVTLAMHEIAHGLNFSGSAFYSSGTGYLGDSEGNPNIYDTFVRDGDGDPLIGYENPSVNLGFALTTNNLWFHGSNAMAANSGSRVRIYAPIEWKSGSSYVHLDYDTFNETVSSLMVSMLKDGTANHDTGPITRGLLSDLGWPDRLEPYAPEIVWASDSTFADKVRISWTRPSTATYFEVYRHTSNTIVGATHLTPDPAESPFDDVYATAGTEYYYWVKACNSAGCSEFSESDAGKRGVFPVPDAPTGVNASDGAYTDMVWISWDEPATATYYKVYRDIDSSIAGAFLLADPVISSAYGDTSAANLLYYYWVRACNSAGCSGYSTPDTGYIAASGPSVPTGVAASDGTYKDKVELTWNASIGAKSYQIYRNTSDNTSDALLLQSGYSTTTYNDASALPGTVYYYWVKACSSEVCSGYSSSDSGHLTFTAPSQPTGVAASDGTSTDMVQISWYASPDATYYQLIRDTINTTSGAIKLVNGHPANAYDDLHVVPDVTYYYWVKACNDEGCSAYSASDSGYRGAWNSIYLPLISK